MSEKCGDNPSFCADGSCGGGGGVGPADEALISLSCNRLENGDVGSQVRGWRFTSILSPPIELTGLNFIEQRRQDLITDRLPTPQEPHPLGVPNASPAVKGTLV